MNAIKRILVPVDFSQPSTQALTCAVEFARRFNAKLVVAHILDDPGTVNPSIPESAVFKRALDDAARKDIHTLLRNALIPDQDVEVVVRAGEVGGELLNIVDAHEIDLVVIG